MLLSTKFQVIARDGGERLGGAERDGRELRRERQHEQVHDQAGESDQAEQQKARRNRVIGELGRQQRGKVERDLAVELAFAVAALVKARRQLDDAQAAAAWSPECRAES